MANHKSKLKSSSGFWILLVAAVVLEATACLQYFYSRAAIDREAVDRARAELRAAEFAGIGRRKSIRHHGRMDDGEP